MPPWPGKDLAIILDAGPALDGGGKQVADLADAPADEPQDQGLAEGGQQAPIHAGDIAAHRIGQQAAQRPAEKAAYAAFHGLFGADVGAKLMLAQGGTYEIGRRIPQPRGR